MADDPRHEKEQRRAAALRDNLKRRKAQARAAGAAPLPDDRREPGDPAA